MASHYEVTIRAGSEKPIRSLSLILFVLTLATTINYIDRSSLSVAAPALSAELSITPAQIGLLLSAFSWSYVSFMIFAGWLADRYNPGWVLVAGFVVWSAATFATAFASSVGSLLVLRLVLGFGE